MRFERVWSGRVTRSRRATAPTSQAPTRMSVSVTRTLSEWASPQRSQVATTTAGSPDQSASESTRRSWPGFGATGPLETMPLEPAIERAPAETERLGGEAHVAGMACQRLPDEDG